MTKKDYILIAEEIRLMYQATRQHSDGEMSVIALTTLANNLAHQFYKENNRFDKHKFLSLIEKPY